MSSMLDNLRQLAYIHYAASVNRIQAMCPYTGAECLEARVDLASSPQGQVNLQHVRWEAVPL